MRTDHKELSEHLMLVDLARNDLARICTPGSRYVADLTKVDRYSFVMHPCPAWWVNYAAIWMCCMLTAPV